MSQNMDRFFCDNKCNGTKADDGLLDPLVNHLLKLGTALPCPHHPRKVKKLIAKHN